MDNDLRRYRRYRRFNIPLDVAVKNGSTGLTKDFSREGLGLVLDDFDFDTYSDVELRMNNPVYNEPVEIRGEVVWKKEVEGKWHVGLKMKNIDITAKSDILMYAYDRWLSEQRQNRSLN